MDTFKSIAGTTDDDDPQVQRLIDFYDNDINNALAHYFEHGFEGLSSGVETHSTSGLSHRSAPEIPSRPPPERERPEAVNLHQQMFEEGLVRLPKAPTISNHWQLELGLHRSRQSNEKEVTMSTNPWWVLLLIIPRSLVSLVMWLWSVVSPKDAPHRFSKKYDYSRYVEEYHPQVPETVVTSGFSDAYSEAQSRYQWLVVVLVNDDTESFGRQLVSSEYFNKFYRDGDYSPAKVFYGNVDASAEAHAVGVAYGCRRLPFVAMAANVSATSSVMPSMSVVYKSNISHTLVGTSETPNTISRISRNLAKVNDSYNPQLISARYDLQEIEFSRMLKQQQDQAYQDSLAQDREKKAVRARQQRSEQLVKQRNKLFGLLPEWRDVMSGAVRMAIKLPSGQRQVVSLSPEVTVRELYLYIDSLLWQSNQSNNENDGEGDDNDVDKNNDEVDPLTFEEYFAEFPFTFEVVQPFPRVVVEAATIPISEVSHLKSGANLMVEYLGDEE